MSTGLRVRATGLVDHGFSRREEGDGVGLGDGVSAVLGEISCSTKPASAVAASSKLSASGSMPRARSRWNSVNDIGRPPCMYFRDCDGELEALFGMPSSRRVRG